MLLSANPNSSELLCQPLDISAFSSKGSIGFDPELPHTTAFKHRIISVYIHEQYQYGTEEDANVVRFRPKIRVQFSRSPREDIRFLSYIRIYIIMERKEGFLSFADSIPHSNAKFPTQHTSTICIQNYQVTVFHHRFDGKCSISIYSMSLSSSH